MAFPANERSMKLHDEIGADLQAKRLVIKPASGFMSCLIEYSHLLLQRLVVFVGKMNIHHGHFGFPQNPFSRSSSLISDTPDSSAPNCCRAVSSRRASLRL